MPAHLTAGRAGDAVVVQRVVGRDREQLLDRDAGLEAGERLPEAEVDPPAERQVAADVAVEVEQLGRRRTRGRRGWRRR